MAIKKIFYSACRLLHAKCFMLYKYLDGYAVQMIIRATRQAGVEMKSWGEYVDRGWDVEDI
jgi:hypothetical protein